MIRILVADDHPVVREGLKRIVEECSDMNMVGEAGDWNEIQAAVKTLDAHVLLLDVSMPGPGLLEVMRRVHEVRPGLRILVLSVNPEDHYAVRALRAGASGYLTKERSPEHLAEAIRRVARGERYVSQDLAQRLLIDLDPGAERPPHEMLSDREFQILQLLGAGRSVKEIATQLALSPKTVSTYRARVLQKMQLKGNADIIRYAVKHELTA